MHSCVRGEKEARSQDEEKERDPENERNSEGYARCRLFGRRMLNPTVRTANPTTSNHTAIGKEKEKEKKETAGGPGQVSGRGEGGASLMAVIMAVRRCNSMPCDRVQFRRLTTRGYGRVRAMPRQPARAQTSHARWCGPGDDVGSGSGINTNVALKKKGRLLKSAGPSDAVRNHPGLVWFCAIAAALGEAAAVPRPRNTKATNANQSGDSAHSQSWKAANGSSASAGSPAIGVVSTTGMSSRSCRDNAANAASEAVLEDGITVRPSGKQMYDSPSEGHTNAKTRHSHFCTASGRMVIV